MAAVARRKTATLPAPGEVARMFPEPVLTCRERDHHHADYPAEEQPQGITAGGLRSRIRQAAPGDREALAAMLTRCSVATRHGRFHAPVRSFPEPYFSEALAGRAEHFALVAEHDGAPVALASCRIDPAGGAELGILVEDRWQRRGIGTRLLSRLIQHADQHGLRPLKATVLAEQRWVLRVLCHHGTCQAAYTFNAFDVTLHRSPATSANECNVCRTRQQQEPAGHGWAM